MIILYCQGSFGLLSFKKFSVFFFFEIHAGVFIWKQLTVSSTFGNLVCGQSGKRLSVDSQIVRLGESYQPYKQLAPSSIGALRALCCDGVPILCSNWVNHGPGRFKYLFWEEKQMMNSSGAYANNFQNLDRQTDASISNKKFKFRSNHGLECL